MAAGYRRDAQTRCSRCHVAVPKADLFMTTEGLELCASCRLAAADEELKASRSSSLRPRPGYRLMCPDCRLATMTTAENDVFFVARCGRCGHQTWQLRGVVFMIPVLLVGPTLLADAKLGGPFLTLLMFGAFAFLTVYDRLRRLRHPVATIEQIEEADKVTKEEARRVEPTEVRIAAPAPSEVDREAEAEAEAQGSASTQRRYR